MANGWSMVDGGTVQDQLALVEIRHDLMAELAAQVAADVPYHALVRDTRYYEAPSGWEVVTSFHPGPDEPAFPQDVRYVGKGKGDSMAAIDRAFPGIDGATTLIAAGYVVKVHLPCGCSYVDSSDEAQHFIGYAQDFGHSAMAGYA